MGIMIAAVGIDPGVSSGGGSIDEALAVGAFVVVGIFLLLAAIRLVSRHGHARHAVRYTAIR